nr:pyrroline-5-carboxylate synthetase [Tanacetum cinerariifolium]
MNRTTRIIDTIKAQQIALDDALVTHANRLKIRKCNHRLSFDLKSNEPTLQVICPRLPGQKFEDPPFEEEILSFIRDLSHTGEIKVLTDVNVNYMHQPWRSFAAIINKCLSGKTTGLDNLCLSHSKAYKEYYAVASGVEPPKAKTKYKKKTKAKGLVVLSEVALSEAKQIKLATKRSKKDFYIPHASGSGVPDVPPYKSESDKKSWGDSEDEDDNDDDGESNDYDDDSDDERTESDSDEIPDPNLTSVDQTEYEEEDVEERARTPSDYELTNKEKLDDEESMDDEEEDEVIKELYDDVNVNLGNKDTEMTDANQGGSKQQNVSQELRFEQEEEDAHVTLTLFLNLEYPSPVDNEIASLMETSAPHATAILEITSGFTTTTPSPPPFFNPLLQQQTPNITMLTFTIITSTNPIVTLPEIPNFASVFKFDQMVSALESEMYELKQTDQFAKAVSSISGIVDKYLTSKMKEAVNQDQEFVMGENDEQPINKEVTKADWFKKLDRPLTPNPDWSKRCQIDFRPPQTCITQAALAEEPPTSFDLYAFILNMLKIPNLTHEILVGPTFNMLKGTCKSITKLEYHLEEYSKATTERLDWHNLENKSYSFDLRKPFPRYLTSITKTKATTYELKWIEDLVPKLWSLVVVKYDQHAYFGTSHWGPKRQSFYEYASNLTSSKDVYSKRRIIAVTRLTIMKKYDYDHLEEIEVCQDDQRLYMFKESDFKRLRLQDIEDMLLLLIQQKLTNLTIDKRYDLNMALRMFTRRIVLQRRVKDLQLGVEIYQKKLNLTKLDTFCLNLRNKTAYTSHSDPHGLIYVDQFKRKRLMRTDELYKFSDGNLNDVQTALHDIATGIRMDYLPIQNWKDLPRDIPLDSIEVFSDTKVFTMTMEILLEPTSNKLLVERFDTSAGNPVKEILLKLNLPNHRLILTDSKVTPPKHGRMTKPYSSPHFMDNCFNVGYLKMEVKVTKQSPEETKSVTGGYGKATSHVIIELETVKRNKAVEARPKMMSGMTCYQNGENKLKDQMRYYTRFGLSTSQEEIPELVKVYLVIPRGNNKLASQMKNSTKIPVLGHSGLVESFKCFISITWWKRYLVICQYASFESLGNYPEKRNALIRDLIDFGVAQRLSQLRKKVKAIPKSAWTEKDQIDSFLKERRLMRSLEKFVGGRLYEKDLRMPQRII